jgi:antitoxin (DNA-binding transcriptional repressor) of toxin-antitoxin stability system
MRNITLAAAKANLSKLIERAAAGETVRITRCGKPVTEVKTPRNQIDHLALGALTEAMTAQKSPRGISFAGRGIVSLFESPSAYVTPAALTNEARIINYSKFSRSPSWQLHPNGSMSESTSYSRKVPQSPGPFNLAEVGD